MSQLYVIFRARLQSIFLTSLLVTLTTEAPLAASLDVRIGYLQWVPDPGPVLSNVIPEPKDAGLRGAELAIDDNSTTGKFLGQTYSLQSEVADSEETAIAAFETMRQSGIELFVINAPPGPWKPSRVKLAITP